MKSLVIFFFKKKGGSRSNVFGIYHQKGKTKKKKEQLGRMIQQGNQLGEEQEGSQLGKRQVFLHK